jgi:cytochrome c553
LLSFSTTEAIMTRIAVVLASASMLLAAASAHAQSKVDEGAALFSSQKCTMCHSAIGKGNPKGSLDGVAGKHSPKDIKQWLIDPEGMRSKTGATRTPAMRPMKLTPAQVDALVEFLSSLKPQIAAADAAK